MENSNWLLSIQKPEAGSIISQLNPY